MTETTPTLTEAEREELTTFDTGIYACAAEGYCSGYDHSLPGHDHEDIYDVVARIKAAARREALLEVERLQTLLNSMDHFAEVAERCEAKSNEYAAKVHRVEAQIEDWEGWAALRSTTRIDAFRDAAEAIRAALAEPERDEESGR